MFKKQTFNSAKSYKGKKPLTTKQKIIIIVASAVAALAIAAVIIYFCIGANDGAGGSGNSGGGVLGGLLGSGSDEQTPVLKSFYISSEPSKKSYYVGDDVNYSGLEIYLRGENLTQYYVSYDEAPDDFKISGFDSSAPAEKQTITVEYGGFTDTFVVEIKELPVAQPTLTDIHLDPMPKTEYKLGEPFTIKDAMIVCTYSDGSTKSVALELNHLSGFSAIKNGVGTYTITVKYRENGIVAQTTYTVTVTE